MPPQRIGRPTISHLVQFALVALIMLGLFQVWRSGLQRSAARLEFQRLARLTGDLTLTDPMKVHVLALQTAEPLHFAWRIYLPPHCRLTVMQEGGSSTSSYSDAQHLIARVRFRQQPDGRLQIYTRFGGGSSQMSFGNEALAEFLRGRWDQVQVEQLGSLETVVVPAGEKTLLLRLSLPEALAAEAAQADDLRRHFARLPLLYEMQFLPQTSKP